MNDLELLTTIISVILTVVTTILSFLSKHNKKAKKYYESYLNVLYEIKDLCIVAERSYNDGSKKKKYVISQITIFLKQNNISIDNDEINKIIESVINVSKNIN